MGKKVKDLTLRGIATILYSRRVLSIKPVPPSIVTLISCHGVRLQVRAGSRNPIGHRAAVGGKHVLFFKFISLSLAPHRPPTCGQNSDPILCSSTLGSAWLPENTNKAWEENLFP